MTLIMDMIACKIAGRNSNTAMETVSFSLMPFDKVRFYMHTTDVSDAGPIDQLKMRIAVFMTVRSTLAGRQSETGYVKDFSDVRWQSDFLLHVNGSPSLGDDFSYDSLCCVKCFFDFI